MLGHMDAAQAIADLTEISPQVRKVVAVAPDGSVAGSNLPDETAAKRLADGARRLHEAAESMRPGVLQLEAATLAGSVFVVRDGERMIAATTTPEPTVGLVFYDLKTCLRSIEEPAKPKPAPKRKPPARKDADDAAT
jgi:predicted regulator of Ras-like GTPase activity (Roadblock/LC7/MglB family)